MKTKLPLLALLLSGCCACPPPPYTDVQMDAVATTAIQWASIDTIGYSGVWDGDDSVSFMDVNVIAIAKPPAEPLGPWPCRWVYGVRRVPAACPLENQRTYTIKDGVVTNIEESTYGCLVMHWDTVRDSVWHCGSDNGEFTQ